jgi:hypothetical protein
MRKITVLILALLVSVSLCFAKTVKVKEYYNKEWHLRSISRENQPKQN